MRARELFIVGLRLFGAWMVLQAIAYACEAVEVHLKILDVRLSTESSYWFHGGVDLIVGLLLLTNARFFANLFDWNFSRPGHCAKCGYDLRGSPDKCPECGTAPTSSG